MAITAMQLATAGSAVDLVAQVKANIANSFHPTGSLKGVHATVGGKVEYFQAVATGATAATDYQIVARNDRADFTIAVNALIITGWQPLGDPSVVQLGPGRTIQYAQAFTKA